MPKTGKFIVIDGTDGSGKTTQLQLLARRLRQEKKSLKIIDFPQYGQKSAGLVENYLNGDYGAAQEVGPYRAAIFYAADRYDASFKIKKWLRQGKIVLANRYVAANMAHQGGKINNAQKRQTYFKWLDNLEYGIFSIPRPDINLILKVPAAIAQKLATNKDSQKRKKIYQKKKDIHEHDLRHLQKAEKVYGEIAKKFPNFRLIVCAHNGQIMPKEKIRELVWREVKKII